MNYQDQRLAEIAIIQSLIYANGVQAITGPVHQQNEVNQTNDAYDNLVAYDGLNYRFVRVATPSNSDNATSLLAAYTEAKLLTPGGMPLSATNRVAMLLPPGTYAFGNDVFAVDAEFIDFIGLGPNAADVIISSAYITDDGRGTITKTVDDVTFANLTIHNEGNTLVNVNSNDASAYAPQVSAPNEVFKNVRFTVADYTSAWPTRLEVNYAGTYIDCWSDPTSQYTFMDAPGTFIGCSTGDLAWQVASGTFKNCTATNGFVSVLGTVSDCTVLSGFGTLSSAARVYRCTVNASGFNGSSAAGAIIEDCTVANAGFTSAGLLSGTYINCSGGNGSFSAPVLNGTFSGCRVTGNGFGNATATLTGTFTNCTATGGGFLGSDLSGTFTQCVGGTGSFNGTGVVLSGTFTDCTAGPSSFGGTNSTLSGTFTRCSAGGQSFGYGVSSLTPSLISGTFRHCVGSDDCFGRNTSITSAALFEHCVGRDRCFGQGATNVSSVGVAGTFRYCSGRDACFGAGMSGGKTASGTFEYCEGRNGCFGAGPAVEASGTFLYCKAGTTSFGAHTNHGTGEAPTASGTFRYCVGGDNCFGSSSGNDGTVVASGKFKGCVGGEACFGSVSSGSAFSDASGLFEDCTAGYQSFGLQVNGSGEMTGVMVNCKLVTNGQIGVADAKGVISGRMENCQIKTDGSPVLLLAAGARIYGCTVVAGDNGASFDAAGPITAAIAHTRGSAGGINVSITNSIGTPYNIFDSDIL